MDTAVAALVFAPALAIGSFLNVIASRLPVGQSVAWPGSHCPHCSTPIQARDNIPLLSFLFLRGRCRSCHASISWRYPAVEFTTAALTVACVLAFGVTVHALSAAIFCAALVVISATDLERLIVPNKIVLPATIVVLALQMVWKPSIEWLAAGLAAAGFLFIVALIYPRGMGMGDVKLMLLIGVAVGWVVPVAFMVGMVAALIPSIVLFARHGTAARKRAIPFAPFLALGGITALFFGHFLAHLYLETLH